MSFRQVFRTLLRRASPIMYSTTFIFANDSEAKQPTENDRLKFDPVDTKKLTAEYMIRQSAVDAVNSATQALTVIYTVIMTASDEYKTVLTALIILSRETLQFTVTDKHWDAIMKLRSKAHTKKEMLNNLTGYVQYVQKMAVAVTEMSYLSGMDNLSVTLSQRIDDALKNIQQEGKYIETLEQEYNSVQEQCIRHESKSIKDEFDD